MSKRKQSKQEKASDCYIELVGATMRFSTVTCFLKTTSYNLEQDGTLLALNDKDFEKWETAFSTLLKLSKKLKS